MRPLAALLVLLAVSVLGGCGDGTTRSTPGQTSPSDSSGSGIAGVVRLGPRCPVQRADRPCPDRTAAGSTVTVTRRPAIGSGSGGAVVTRTTTDADGRYRVAVRPGTYVVTADAGMSCLPATVQVHAGTYAKVDLRCDTGIR